MQSLASAQPAATDSKGVHNIHQESGVSLPSISGPREVKCLSWAVRCPGASTPITGSRRNQRVFDPLVLDLSLRHDEILLGLGRPSWEGGLEKWISLRPNF